jgi:E3 ubiquitin-protein ligase makorin
MAPTLPCRFYALGKCNNGSNCTFIHETGKAVCQFYLQGNCRFGNYCEFKHEKPKAKQPVKPKSIPVSKPVQIKSEVKMVSKFQKGELGLCPFHLTGNCKNTECKYTHGIECPVCEKNCLDPQKPETHDEHITKCKKERVQEQVSKEKECVVCFETVKEKRDARFGLLDCEHCVCLECIRTWREAERVDTSKVFVID